MAVIAQFVGALADLVGLCLACVSLLRAHDPFHFDVALATAVVLAAISWLACARFGALWNRTYHLRTGPHILLGAASAFLVCLLLVFASTDYMNDAAHSIIQQWRSAVRADRGWQGRTYSKAYWEVKALGKEDFSSAPPPGSPGTKIPTTTRESQLATAQVYANDACHYFESRHPLLSKVVWANPGVPLSVLLNDISLWFKTNRSYPVERAVEIAATQIGAGLDAQAPRVVAAAKAGVLLLIALLEIIQLALIGRSAYESIKIRT